MSNKLSQFAFLNFFERSFKMKRQVFRGTKSYSKQRENFKLCAKHSARFVSLDPIDGEVTKRTRRFNLLKEKGKSPIVLVKCSCRETKTEYVRAWFKRGEDPIRKYVDIT